MFSFTTFLTFFALAMPTTMEGMIPDSMNFMDYTASDMNTDLSEMISSSEASVSSSESSSSDNTLNIESFGVSWGIFTKVVSNIFLGYYQLGIFFADSLEPTTTSGPIHILFGGIGAIFSIVVIVGFLLMVRSVVFRV